MYLATLGGALTGARARFIFLLFALLAYYICYRHSLKKFQRIVCIISIISPMIAFFPLLSISASAEDSNFKKILEYIGEKVGGDAEFKTDTRTFLYIEMALDLTKNDAWIFGKGANSRYFSEYFSQIPDGDSYNRLSSEVPFLHFTLRGGLIYSTLYLFFLILCIYRAIKKGKNSFINCIGIMIAAWYVYIFIGDINGCSFYHIIFFSLCGLTLSNKWVNMTDSDIKRLINCKSIDRI